jgi:hypothetical protein
MSNFEKPGDFTKLEFSKSEFRPECSYFQKNRKKWVTIKFYIFLGKGFRHFFLFPIYGNAGNKFTAKKCRLLL